MNLIIIIEKCSQAKNRVNLAARNQNSWQLFLMKFLYYLYMLTIESMHLFFCWEYNCIKSSEEWKHQIFLRIIEGSRRKYN